MNGRSVARASAISILLGTVACGEKSKPAESVAMQDRSVQAASDRKERELPLIIADTQTSCNDCMLVSRDPGTMLVESESATIFALPRVEQLASGDLLVGTPGGALTKFDASGRQRNRIGAKGRGPGEIDRLASFATVPGDSVLVVSADRRVLLFDSTATFVRQTIVKANVGGNGVSPRVVEPIDNGAFVLSSHVPTRELAGVPMFFVDQSSRVLQSFGTPNLIAPGAFSHHLMSFDPSNGVLWTAEVGSYRFDRVSTNCE